MPLTDLVRRDFIMEFGGVVNVGLFEAPFNPLPASVNAGWHFSPSSSHPTICGQAFSGIVVTAYDAIVLTPFVFNTVKYPGATTILSTYDLARKPVFWWNSLADYVELIGVPFSTYVWEAPAVITVNTFSKTSPGRLLVWNNTTIGNHVGESVNTSLGPNVYSENFRPAVGNWSIDNNGFIYVFGVSNFGPGAGGAIYTPAYKFAGAVASPALAYTVPDFVFNANYGMMLPDVFNPRPNVISFGLDLTSIIQVPAWRRLFLGNAELDNLFDLSVTADWGLQGLFLVNTNGGGNIWFSPHSNSITPGTLGTFVITNQDSTKYWLLNLIPKSAKARSMLQSAPASWRLARDPNGIYYFGSGIDNRTVLTSFGLSLPFYWPDAKLPSLSIPCPGVCVPVPLNIPSI